MISNRLPEYPGGDGSSVVGGWAEKWGVLGSRFDPQCRQTWKVLC